MATRPRTFGSLFAGIGGFDLGAEANGMHCAWQVEIDLFCRAALAHHWPDVDRSVIDVRAASSLSLARVDAIIGGFPCNDLSSSGRGEGLDGERSGLWREHRRIIEELTPEWAFVENVESGAPKWLPFVRSDLESLGYRTAALLLYAHDAGAPHRRGRIFVVAHRDGVGRKVERIKSVFDGQRAAFGRDVDGCDGSSAGRRVESGLGGDAYGISGRLAQHSFPAPRGHTQKENEPPRTMERPKTQAEKKSINRTAKLRAYGNAIVPQCAELGIRWGLERFGAA
jgi:DNA (cytosine-5)-methyltransferase 1